MSVVCGDCVEQMALMDAESVDAIVTDPPYSLNFMGKAWDNTGVANRQETWQAALRVLKPGGHLVAFGGTRTYHRMVCAVEDAGFEIRDCLMYLYGVGFPKSLNFGCRCPRDAVQYGHETVSREVVPGVRPVVAAPDPLSGSQEPDLFAGVRQRSDSAGASGSETGATQDDHGAMLGVRPTDHEARRVAEAGSGADVLTGMQRQAARRRTGKAQSQGPGSVDGGEQGVLPGEDDRGEQSGVEGRRLLPAQEGQLHPADQVCVLPAGVPADGTEGRVCDGTSADRGTAVGPSARPRRSGASSRPRPDEQPAVEPDAVPVERGAQAGGACPACGGLIGWSGWGTALKPACEPIVLARKPLQGTVAANVTAHGVGALNIDACRIGFVSAEDERESKDKNRHADFGTAPGGNAVYGDYSMVPRTNYAASGRWPANLLLDDASAEQLGDAARFFYCAKVSSKERNAGLDGERCNHPTLKPIVLMRWLCRLVTPPNGLVLDPFAGSGSTLIAAHLEGFRSIGIEQDSEYCRIAEARLAHWTAQQQQNTLL